MSLLRTSEINRRNAKLSVLRIVQARVGDEPDLFRILHPFLATFLLDREAGVQASGLNCTPPPFLCPARCSIACVSFSAMERARGGHKAQAGSKATCCSLVP